jgi:hypothetical protein
MYCQNAWQQEMTAFDSRSHTGVESGIPVDTINTAIQDTFLGLYRVNIFRDGVFDG